jgi:hypothetical protein
MRSILLAFAVCSAAPAAFAQPVSANDIVDELPGLWVMNEAAKVSDPPKVDCKKQASRIWFESSGNGDLTFFSRQEGEMRENNYFNGSRQVQSDVRFIPDIWKTGMGAIRVQYVGETRLDEQGKPVAWILFMPNRNMFYWHREGWPEGAVTAPSYRCPDPSLIG